MKNLFKLNLQLFAASDYTPDYNPNATSSEGLSAEMKTFYDKVLLKAAKPNLVHDQFGQERNIPKHGGKKIEFRMFKGLSKALKPLTEGIPPKGKSLTVTSQEATVSQYGDYAALTDVIDLTAIDDTFAETVGLMGDQAGLTLDTITRNILNSGTNVSFASKWSGTTETPVTKRGDLDNTSVLKVDTVNQVVAKLRSVNAKPIDGKYYVGIIHPQNAYEIMRDPDWREPHQYVDTENIYLGEIGKIGGVRFVESSEAKIFGPEKGLLINNAEGYTGAITSVAFDGNLEGVDVEASALVGKYIRINGKTAKITSNSTSTITFDSTNFDTVADNDEIDICPCAAGAVYSTLIIAKDAYGKTSVEGGGLKTIIKTAKEVGGPLEQFGTVGWKALKTAKILMPDYLVRIESTSPRFSATAENN